MAATSGARRHPSAQPADFACVRRSGRIPRETPPALSRSRHNPVSGSMVDATPRMDPLPSFRADEAEVALSDPRNFINRDLSNFTFIERILEEAADSQVPLMDRMRFLGILSVALDEFFMIRVAGLKQQIAGHVEETGPDLMTPAEQLQAISQRCHAVLLRQDQILLEQVLPGLEKA